MDSGEKLLIILLMEMQKILLTKLKNHLIIKFIMLMKKREELSMQETNA